MALSARATIIRMMKICKENEEAERCPKDKDGKDCPLWKFHCGIPEAENEISEMLKIITEYKEETEGICQKCKADLKKVSGANIIKYCPYCGEKIRIKTQENNSAE